MLNTLQIIAPLVLIISQKEKNMKKTKKFYATLVLTAFAMIAMIVGIYAVLNNVAMQASGNITYKAFGCDVKVVGQISNAVKESADGTLFYNNNIIYF